MADSRKVYVGEIGKRIKVKVGIALDNLSSAKLKVEKPDGAVAVEWVAIRLGRPEDGTVYYDTIAGDLNVPGIYRLYAALIFADGRTYFGQRTMFEVFNPSEG